MQCRCECEDMNSKLVCTDKFLQAPVSDRIRPTDVWYDVVAIVQRATCNAHLPFVARTEAHKYVMRTCCALQCDCLNAGRHFCHIAHTHTHTDTTWGPSKCNRCRFGTVVILLRVFSCMSMQPYYSKMFPAIEMLVCVCVIELCACVLASGVYVRTHAHTHTRTWFHRSIQFR